MTVEKLFTYASLTIFILVVTVNVGFLLYDVCLVWREQVTLSRLVWDRPRLAVAVVGWQLVGAIALTVHLLIAP